MIGDPFKRFVIMKQVRPFRNMVSITYDGSPPTMEPMDWQVVDEGVPFDAPWNEKTEDAKVLASFAYEGEAVALRSFLVNMALKVQRLEEELSNCQKMIAFIAK
jgi:hypothetical protein